MSTPSLPRVSIRPYILQDVPGYRVRWTELFGRKKTRAYFVRSLNDARYVRRRAKDGKVPGTRCWAVAC